jgi:hypothetical protein
VSIENSPLQEEIDAILGSPPNPVHAQYSCSIVTPDWVIHPNKLLSLDIQRDYLSNFSDVVILEVALPEGTYQQKVIPYQQSLKIELIRSLVGETGGTPIVENDEPWLRTYRGILEDGTDNAASADSKTAPTAGAANLDSLITVKIQLLDEGVDQIRMSQVGGIYYDEIPGNVLKYIITNLSKQLDLPDEEAIGGVDCVKFDNQSKHTQISIPHGTKPQDVAMLIQTDWGGVYNAGIGCYLQEAVWYIWPPYNYSRYDQERITLQFINLPPTRYPGIERTYRTTGSGIIALSTGEVSQQDNSSQEQVNSGNATRFTHTDQMWKGINTFDKNFGESGKDNKFIVKRTDNNSEFVGIEKAGIVNAPVSDAKMRNNSFVEPSKLAAKNGSFMTLVWEYSKPEVIYPGQPVRIQYLKNDEVMEVDGVVAGAHHYIHDTSTGPIQHRHICNSAVTVFIAPLNP